MSECSDGGSFLRTTRRISSSLCPSSPISGSPLVLPENYHKLKSSTSTRLSFWVWVKQESPFRDNNLTYVAFVYQLSGFVDVQRITNEPHTLTNAWEVAWPATEAEKMTTMIPITFCQQCCLSVREATLAALFIPHVFVFYSLYMFPCSIPTPTCRESIEEWCTSVPAALGEYGWPGRHT